MALKKDLKICKICLLNDAQDAIQNAIRADERQKLIDAGWKSPEQVQETFKRLDNIFTHYAGMAERPVYLKDNKQYQSLKEEVSK